MIIPILDLVAQYHTIKEEMDHAVLGVLESGKFIMGPNVALLEKEIAAYLGVKHAIGVANGTDALVIALRTVGIQTGDEVIAPAYSFFATAGAILAVGGKPVFVDINPETYLIDINNLEDVITPRTRAIIPVHLYGQPADMDEIMTVAQKHQLSVIEDNAQAFGAEYRGKKTAAIGDIGCLSFFPSKNLGAYGDSGMIATNSDELAERARMLRTHGWKKKYFPEMLGYNSRLDEMQAAILRVKLKYVDSWNDRRREIAHKYSRQISKFGILPPTEASDRKHVYHLYMVPFLQRDNVQQQLKEKGIASEVYYPQSLHLAAPCRNLGYVEGQFPISEQCSRNLLALPLYPELNVTQIDEVLGAVETIILNSANIL